MYHTTYVLILELLQTISLLPRSTWGADFVSEIDGSQILKPNLYGRCTARNGGRSLKYCLVGHFETERNMADH